MRVFDVSFSMQVQAMSIADAVADFLLKFNAGQADGWFYGVVDMRAKRRYVYDTKVGAVIIAEPSIPTSEDGDLHAQLDEAKRHTNKVGEAWESKYTEEIVALQAEIKQLRQSGDILRQTISNLEYLYDRARGIDGASKI